MKKRMSWLKRRTEKERKKKDYLKTKGSQPEVLRAKEREKKRRQRKKIADLIKKTSKTSSQVSPQTFGKALSRAKHLPKCPERKVQVLAKIVQDLSPRKRKAVVDLCDKSFKRRKEYSKDRKKRCDALTDDEIQKVQNFYLREDISRMLPGKKDYVSVKLADGKREHR